MKVLFNSVHLNYVTVEISRAHSETFLFEIVIQCSRDYGQQTTLSEQIALKESVKGSDIVQITI